MKKVLYGLLAVLMTASVSLVTLTACGTSSGGGAGNGGGPTENEGNGNNSNGEQVKPNEDTLNLEISGLDYGFVKSSDVPDLNDLTIDKYNNKLQKFDINEEYNLIISYNITPEADNKDKIIETFIDFKNVKYLDGSIKHSNSSDGGRKVPIKDSNTSEDGIRLPVSHKIPSTKGESFTVEIIVRFNTKKLGESSVNIGFQGDNINFKGSSFNGITHQIDIQQVKLDTPVITYDDARGNLVFNHVKHADKYLLYIDNKKVEGVEYVVDNIDAGSKIKWSILEYLDKNITSVKIIAIGDGVNYLDSSYSEEIEITK